MSKASFNLPCTKIGTDHGCVGLLQSVGREYVYVLMLLLPKRSIQALVHPAHQVDRSEGVDDFRVCKVELCGEEEGGTWRKFSSDFMARVRGLPGSEIGVDASAGW